MKLHDGTILMHKIPYDPVKAHEYYIRTRQLKGRKKGSKLVRTSNRSAVKSPTFRVNLGNGKTVDLTAKQLAEQKAYAAERVTKIKKKLGELNTKLRKAMSEARNKKARAEREGKKAPSASDRSKAARESKEYRKEHKQELATDRKKEAKKSAKKDPVEDLTDRITEIKDKLTDAVAKQRALSTATRNS